MSIVGGRQAGLPRLIEFRPNDFRHNSVLAEGHLEPRGRRLDVARTAIVGSGAAAALFMLMSSTAVAACVASAGTVTCTGDASAGVQAGPPNNTLDVNALTQDITPASGTSGISFLVNGPVTIVSNTGAFKISTSGANAYGIDASSYDGSSVNIDHTGTIVSLFSAGILATSSGDIIEQSNGNISAGANAIEALGYSFGKVSIDHTGALNSTGGDGVYVTNQGKIDVTIDGPITSSGDGLHLYDYDVGAITIDETGAIQSSNGYGIFTTTQGSITDVSRGAIQANEDGILAKGLGTGAISVDHTGDITSTLGEGVNANTQGNVTINLDGSIKAATTGIYAHSSGKAPVTVSVTHLGGSITALDGTGISASAPNGHVSVSNAGLIDASGDGINAQNAINQSVVVDQTGTITAGGRGIYAYSSSGYVDVSGTGDIQSVAAGVYGISHGGTVSITQTGDISSSNNSGIIIESPAGSAVLNGAGKVTAQGTAISIAVNGPGGSINVDRANGGDIQSFAAEGIDASSSSGSVYLTNTGAILAYGDGIHARSLGSGTESKIWQSGNVTSTTGAGIWNSTSQGAVAVNLWGNVQANTVGIFAHNTGSGSVNVMLSGNINADTGRGIDAFSSSGAVTVASHGTITAHDEGIFAANTASGAPISVTQDSGDVTSSSADAIYASSSSSQIDVTTNGNITGANHGIHVAGNQNLTININAGTVTGGSSDDKHAAVELEGGAQNHVVNFGIVENRNGIESNAIIATKNNTAIDNYGTIVGTISLSPWTNSFHNMGANSGQAAGLFNMGKLVDLGNLGNLLTNDGIVSPGGVGVIEETTINGSFLNSKTGTMLSDVNLSTGTGDLVQVNGEANLSGDVAVHFSGYSPDLKSVALVHADQFINTQDLTYAGNPIVSAHVTYPTNKEADLTIDGFQFAPVGLTDNAGAIGTYLDSALTDSANPSPGLYPIAIGLLNLTTLDQINKAMDELSPNIYMAEQEAALHGASDFADDLYSCKVADGASYFSAEGQCGWVRADYATLSHQAGELTGFSSTTWDMAGGTQSKLNGDWHAGVAGGLVGSTLSADGVGTAYGNAVEAGAVLKYSPGPLTLAASLSSTYGWYNNNRTVSFGNFSDTANGTSQVGTVNARVRAGYTFQKDNYYLKPQIDLNATYIHTTDFAEAGSAAALFGMGGDQAVFSAVPSLEIGGQTELDDGSIFRPFLRGGAVVYSDTNVKMQGGFVGDASNTGSFTVTSSADSLLWNLSAGIDLLRPQGQTIRAYYNQTLGATTNAKSAGFKLSFNY